jgi:hypothetical protein
MSDSQPPERRQLGPLTRLEWITLGKLIAIFAMSVVLLQGSISFDLDIEKFIYGRF